VTYSAFGEVLDASGSPGGSAPAGFPRYQYAGAWGYETGGYAAQGAGGGGGGGEPDLGFGDERHLLCLYGVNPNLPPITLQHVGYRWYDPSIGRYVQAAWIKLWFRLSAYEYGRSAPKGPVSLWDDFADGVPPGWKGGGVFGAPKPPPGWRPPQYDVPHTPPWEPPELTTEQELELIRRDVLGLEAWASLLGFLCPPMWAGVAGANLLDMCLHWDEPANPIYGGEYENWPK
jgi:hypothetical protein